MKLEQAADAEAGGCRRSGVRQWAEVQGPQNTAVQEHATGLVCSKAAAEVQVPRQLWSSFVFIRVTVNCTWSCRSSLCK